MSIGHKNIDTLVAKDADVRYLSLAYAMKVFEKGCGAEVPHFGAFLLQTTVGVGCVNRLYGIGHADIIFGG